MDFIAPDILAGELTPVLLGFSPETVEIARRMHQKYGVLSHVFCDKVPFAMRLSLFMKFHFVQHTKNETLMVQALTDFAEPVKHADVILYLIPCNEDYAGMIWEHGDLLESRYVVANEEQIERILSNEDKKEDQT